MKRQSDRIAFYVIPSRADLHPLYITKPISRTSKCDCLVPFRLRPLFASLVVGRFEEIYLPFIGKEIMAGNSTCQALQVTEAH